MHNMYEGSEQRVSNSMELKLSDLLSLKIP